MGGGGTNTVQKSDPWAGVQPYLEGYNGATGVLPEALRLYQSGGPQYFPGNTIADPSAQTLNAENAAMQFAQSPTYGVGTDTLNTAQNYLSSVVSGAYRTGNPYTDVNSSVYTNNPWINGSFNDMVRDSFDTANPMLGGMVDSASKDITRNFTNAVVPSLNSTFASGGRYGSGAQVS